MNIEPGKVVLFANDKEGKENRPDYRGELVTPTGEHCEIAIWNSMSGKGLAYLSGRVQAPREENSNGQTTTVKPTEPKPVEKSQLDLPPGLIVDTQTNRDKFCICGETKADKCPIEGHGIPF